MNTIQLKKLRNEAWSFAEKGLVKIQLASNYANVYHFDETVGSLKK